MQRRDFLKLFGMTAAALAVPVGAPAMIPADADNPPRTELDFLIRKSTIFGIGHELLPGIEYLLRLKFEEPAQIRYLSTPPIYNEILLEEVGDPNYLIGNGVDLGYFSSANGCGVPVDFGIQNPLPIRMRTLGPEPAMMTIVMLIDFYEDKSIRPGGYPWNLWPDRGRVDIYPDLKKDDD